MISIGRNMDSSSTTVSGETTTAVGLPAAGGPLNGEGKKGRHVVERSDNLQKTHEKWVV